MFSSSALSGSICLRCQLRAVTPRARPLLVPVQVRRQRRQYASNAKKIRQEKAKHAAEIKNHDHEKKQGFNGPEQKSPDETSASDVAMQNLRKEPRVAQRNASNLDRPDQSDREQYFFGADTTNLKHGHGSPVNADDFDSMFRGVPKNTAKSGKVKKKSNRRADQSFGAPQRQKNSQSTAPVETRTCLHCQKLFASPSEVVAHVKHGCPSVSPNEHIKCTGCGHTFDKTALLHRHWRKDGCSPEGPNEPKTPVTQGEDQKIETHLSQAAADSASQRTSHSGQPITTDNSSVPHSQEPKAAYDEAAAPSDGRGKIGKEHSKEAAVEDKSNTKLAITHKAPDTAASEAILQEETARPSQETKYGEKEKDSTVPQTHRDVKITRKKKEYRRGHMMLVEDASKLDVELLGKEAEVIILRDGYIRKREEPPADANPPESVDTGFEVNDFLDTHEILSHDGVLRNIHGLKPKGKIVSAREYNSLFKSLLEGFTAVQLENYVIRHREQPFLETINDQVVGEDEASSEEPNALGNGIEQDQENPEITEQSIKGTIQDQGVDKDEISSKEQKALKDGIEKDQENPEITEQPTQETIQDQAVGEDETSNEEPSNEEPKALEDRIEKHIHYPWMTEQAHWIPDVPGAVEDAQYPLAGYILISMPPKQRLVVQLIRECWEISVWELLDGNGHIDVRLRDLELKLLTLGTQLWLKKLSRIFLKGGEQMEVRRSDKLLRIVAPKAVAETFLHALDELLQEVKTKSIRLDQVPIQGLDAVTLEELGRITNSAVQFGHSKEVIQVSWIETRDEKSQSQLEDLRDVVFRLLLNTHTSARISNDLSIYPDVESNARAIEDYGIKEKLPWMDRRRKWARLCLPLKRKQPGTPKACPLTTDILKFKIQPSSEDLALPTSTLKSKLQAMYENATPIGIPRQQPEQGPSDQKPMAQPVEPTPSGWRPFKVTTSAVFGHILHLNEPSLAERITGPLLSFSLASWPRVLSPLIPPVDQMDLPGWVPYDSTKDTAYTILMRFVPYSEDADTDKSRVFADRAPPLELRLNSTDRVVQGIHSLRAINRTSISDILLPTEHVDIRTTQREYAELPASVIDSTEGMEALSEFLQKSLLEPDRGRLVTPPRLHNIGLPRWLITPLGATEGLTPLQRKQQEEEQQQQHSPDTPEGNKLHRISYIFTGLEVHRALETTYEGWKLVYTSIEAGQGGGHRAELSLEAVPGYDMDLRRTRKSINATFFLRSIYQLAKGLQGQLIKRASNDEEARPTISWFR